MNNRPLTPLQTLFLIWNRGNDIGYQADNVFTGMPIEVLRHIKMLYTTYHVIEDVEKLLPYIIDAAGKPVPVEELLGKTLFLQLESIGLRNVGDVVIHSGMTIGHLHPRNVIRYFRDISLDSNGEFIHDINKVLHYVAFGNPAEAKKLLGKKPWLILQRSYVIAPTGDLIWNVTPYECGLCIGDHYRDKDPALSMMPMLASYFYHESIVDGETERQKQYARYKPYLDRIGKEEPYQFKWIYDIVKKSPQQDVAAALAKDFTRNTELRVALTTLRDDFPLRIITRGLLCNYATIRELFKVFADEWGALYEAGNNYEMLRLVWRQVVGRVIHRRLPGCERQAFARCTLLKEDLEHATLERSYAFKNDQGDFPACLDFEFLDDEVSLVGGGWDFACDIYGCREEFHGGGLAWTVRALGILMSNKSIRLAELMQPQRRPSSESESTCVIL